MRDMGEGFNVINIWGDNSACIGNINSPDSAFSARAKHIAVSYYFAREQTQVGKLTFSKIDSEKNTADVFTKRLGKELYDRHVKGLGLKKAVQ